MNKGRLRFELSQLGLHIRFYLRVLRVFLGSSVPLRLSIIDFDQNAGDEFLETQLLSPIRSEFENVDCAIDDQRTSGRGYYLDLCFHIHATATSGQRLEFVDGGSVN